jgi:hypothetical protein
MVDAEDWRWIEDKASGDFDHLLLGTSLPVLLGPGMHYLQAWNEALCAGVWGEGAKRWGRGSGAPRTSTSGPRFTTRSSCSPA